MKNKQMPHTFHIPVMGIGYTIDSPIKLAHFGIDSVVSIIDHIIAEQMREHHSKLNNIPFETIPLEVDDCRAKRITAYLNLMNSLVERNFQKLRNSAFEEGSDITKYFELLPEDSALKAEYKEMLIADEAHKTDMQNTLRAKMRVGKIDVNIMTKLDSVNYSKENEPLPTEYNDAHASFRGFANSSLDSSIVLSAGLNPRLYAYMANFNDFFPDSNGKLKKRIILKVSDYRSALVQGKMLAKKGLWVSEFRIESGLNCGGHAFATEGYLLGPILDEFKENKDQLTEELFGAYIDALEKENRNIPVTTPEMLITAQGGVGTHEEHKLLLEHYNVDSVGWGSPFMLVPESTNVDDETMELLAKTKEDGYYLSEISPLGVLFNSIKGNSGEIEKLRNAESGKPGAPCTKKFLTFNTEYTEKPICTASKQYQKLKIEELDSKNLSPKDYAVHFNKIIDKVCLCVSLANSTLLKNKIPLKPGIQGVSICPGPNLAYFSKIASLKEMVDHIYGRINILHRSDRPNFFLQELKMYINHFKSKMSEHEGLLSKAQMKYYKSFQKNLNEGINYYKDLFTNHINQLNDTSASILENLALLQLEFNSIKIVGA